VEDFEEFDHYELLGVARSASADEIKRAYRREMAKYHPDRFIGADPVQQAYAELRAQRINEAYRVLSDFKLRADYSMSGPAVVSSAKQSTPPPTPQRRDHQAELYERARMHLDADRPLQAIATLQQLQRLNPLYRDSAELLAMAKAQLELRQTEEAPTTAPRIPRKALIAGGIGGALAAAGAIIWFLIQQKP
jgi:curved DNA-binding protein CbpA